MNGEPVPQSAGDPENIIAFAAALTFVIGGISLILGAVVLIFDFNVLKAAGFYGFSVGVGAILLVSAVFILWRKRWALILAFIILILETLIGTYATIYFNLDPNMSILLLRVLSLFPLYKALVVFNKIYPRKKQ